MPDEYGDEYEDDSDISDYPVEEAEDGGGSPVRDLRSDDLLPIVPRSQSAPYATPRLLKGAAGQSQLVPPSVFGRPPQTIADLRGEDSESQLISIALSLPFTDNSTVAPDGNIAFQLEFGVGSSQFAPIIVDAVPGCIVSLPATFVRVRCFNFSSESVMASAGFAYNQKAHVHSPRYTYIPITIGGAAISVPIPPYAKSVNVYADTGNSWQIEFPDSALASVITRRTFGPGVPMENLVFPGLSRYITVTNLGPTVFSALVLVWNLDL